MSGWPLHVVSRYLTVGTATVDVIDTGIWSMMKGSLLGRSVSAACTGCDQEIGEKTRRDWYSDQDQPEVFEDGLRELRKAAQAHAEVCRAMPAPDGAR
ncbi:hypothetical protein AB0H49_34325 [Nocardia sp. NPDC050713]|uniref:hypothetical protein n=1 Tax=Nocardia sp. NPDC050713 TaxID=3154511 RepID=UPI003409BABA